MDNLSPDPDAVQNPILFTVEGMPCPKCEGSGRVPDGKELGVLRRALGVSQEEMALAMGINKSFVSSLENNKRSFNDKHLSTYLDILEQASLAQLMLKADNNPTEIVPE